MRKLKIGDTVTASLFGGELVTGKVEGIEICRQECKKGRPVNQCDLDKHHNGVIDLNCGYWCYFDQVKEIIPREFNEDKFNEAIIGTATGKL